MHQRKTQSLVLWLQRYINPGPVLPGIVSGITLGITEVVFAISLGSLIFSGDLTPFLPRGVGIVLFTASVMLIVTSLGSKVPGVIGSVQDTSSAILAVVVAGLAGVLAWAMPEEKFTSILVAIAASTFLTGLFFAALGLFKLGGLVRYLPYPVVGGFLAGTGWLLIQGSFGVMADYPLNLANLPSLLQKTQMIFWVPSIIFAVVLFWGLRSFKHVLVLPGILIGGVALFYIVLWGMGISIAEATQKGLLLRQITSSAAWHPLVPADLWATNWRAILGQSGNIASILVLSLVSLLLNASALEVAIRSDVDLNRELRAAGFANIISGMGGGIVGYHALSLSVLSYRIGARGRLPGLIAGFVCLSVLFAGLSLMAYIPKPILGGLLFFLGMDFLADWVFNGWKKFSRSEYAIVLLILVVIGVTNFLTGLFVGLTAMVILFAWNYSRINVVYQALSGSDMHSNVERCAHHRQVLAQLGSRILILELQGFIFFGTANSLLEIIRARLAGAQSSKVRYLILDFRRVSGMDSSAGLSFTKIRHLAETQGIQLVLTHISEKIRYQLDMTKLEEKDSTLHIFVDLDHGLEWCEEQLLEALRITGLHTPVALVAQLTDSGLEKASTVRLKNYLERVIFNQGEYLIHQGNEANAIYFIEMGAVSVYFSTEKGENVRLQTFGLGTAVGELDLYPGCPSTASVVADTMVVVYRLTRSALIEMKSKDPELSATFHEFITHLLSERLAAATRTMQAVIR